jgi:hypothetical protein
MSNAKVDSQSVTSRGVARNRSVKSIAMLDRPRCAIQVPLGVPVEPEV